MSDRLYLSLPSMNSDPNLPQKLLSGLGKSTKRGIRKCYNCGAFNGTRSSMCKNKDCGVVLKDMEEKSKIEVDAIKLLTGTEKQIYSVRVRDMGPDYRGFLQLPILQSHSDEEQNIFSEVALCFVDSCQNSFHNSILKCHEEDQNENSLVCAHIRSAFRSQSTALPMEFKNDTLHLLKLNDEIKEKLYVIASEKEGCFVQRVSKSVMAVKCQVSPKHPLGYLHFTFVRGKGRDAYERYYCSCEEYAGITREKINVIRQKCIHYYACIWALASDTKYYDEFFYFIQNELPELPKELSIPDVETVNPNLVSIPPNDSKIPISKLKVVKKTSNKSNSKISQDIKTKLSKMLKQPKKKEIIRKCKKIMPKVLPIEIKVLNDMPQNTSASICWSFLDWLSFVTESINETMHFRNCGILNSLIFHIPQSFYECLIARIPTEYDPIASDVCINYHIMSILHLQKIFDTPQIKLRISKKFIHVDNQGFVEYNDHVQNSNTYQSSFIFFLNVGQSTVDESDNTNNSFVIEWMPSVTSVTNIGQLKFYYKYGRKGI